MSSRPKEKDAKVTGGLSSTFTGTINSVRSKGKIDNQANVDKDRAMKNYQMEDPPGLTPEPE